MDLAVSLLLKLAVDCVEKPCLASAACMFPCPQTCVPRPVHCQAFVLARGSQVNFAVHLLQVLVGKALHSHSGLQVAGLGVAGLLAFGACQHGS